MIFHTHFLDQVFSKGGPFFDPFTNSNYIHCRNTKGKCVHSSSGIYLWPVFGHLWPARKNKTKQNKETNLTNKKETNKQTNKHTNKPPIGNRCPRQSDLKLITAFIEKHLLESTYKIGGISKYIFRLCIYWPPRLRLLSHLDCNISFIWNTILIREFKIQPLVLFRGNIVNTSLLFLSATGWQSKS